ncbi:MAG: S9 family peptidase [Desulfurococcaceae archaeon]|jgi:dipeptidyl aminopeptidase/acylaminoacyl peptidase|nr:S9 family peptidase [Desulfurococcaceae archaeon]
MARSSPSAKSLVEVARIIESVVNTPSYVVYGVTSGGLLLYGSTESGVLDLHVVNPSNGLKATIARGIHLYAKTHPDSNYVVFTRDVSRGFEQCRVYAVNIRSGEFIDLMGSLPPQRIVGLAFNGELVAWSGARGEEAGIYMAKIGSEPELLAKTRGREFVTDNSGEYVVGYGFMRGDPFSTELLILDVSSRELRVYTPREGSVSENPKIRGRAVLFSSDYEDLDKKRLYVLNLETGEVKHAVAEGTDLYDFEPVDYVDYGWSIEGALWAIAKKNGRSYLYVDNKLIGPDSGFVSSGVVHGEYAYIAHSSLRIPPRILALNLKTREVRVLASDTLPGDVLQRIGGVDFVEVKSKDGVVIPVYVLESRSAEKPGPTVIYPHGGPWSEVADSWSPIIATLSALGYHVVAPNFRGSTGYGERFRRMNIGDPGGMDMEDIIAATKWAVESGLADSSRVAIVGYSYGGYTVLMQVSKYPEFWRCGVAGAPVADWEEMYELADAYFKRFEEILFAGRRELFKERSPVNYVENIKAPLCIVQPQNDSRTPLKPVLKFTQKLLEHGKTFELHVVPDIGHAISLDRIALAKFLFYTVLFLDKYMKT